MGSRLGRMQKGGSSGSFAQSNKALSASSFRMIIAAESSIAFWVAILAGSLFWSLLSELQVDDEGIRGPT
jgi:hypothetical protein